MMKVAFFELEGWEHALIRECLQPRGFDILALEAAPLTPESVPRYRMVEAVSVFIYSKITAAVLDRLPRLKVIATRSTGYDHIDVAAARARGIEVCHVPSYGEQTVAEYALMLILALLRRLKSTIERTARGIFSQEGLRGSDLAGRTVGVVGTGRIGRRLVRLLSGFEVQVLACDFRPDPELETRFGVCYLPLEELLQQSDVVSLHVPLTPATRHLIDRRRLQLMKPGSYLVNTSRGGLVDTEAVAEALKSGRLAGIAMDTFEGEEVWMEEELILGRAPSAELLRDALESFYLNRFENALLTPHNAYNTHEAVKRILQTTLDNLIAFKEGGRPRFPVP